MEGEGSEQKAEKSAEEFLDGRRRQKGRKEVLRRERKRGAHMRERKGREKEKRRRRGTSRETEK